MDELEFNRLIEKYQRGLLSGREKELLDEWFESMEVNTHPVSWTKEDKVELKHKILKQIEVGKKKKVFFFDRGTPRSFSTGMLSNAFKAAAFVLLVVAFSYVVWQFGDINKPKVVTTLQASAFRVINKVMLADGSIVWLKPNSTLTYPEEFAGERHVILQGEALFEVAKNPNRKFIIQCGELTTTVLGTSFNIKANEKDIEVIVLTGKVSLTSKNDVQEVIVLPNERAVYNRKEKQIAKVKTEVEKKEKTFGSVATGTEYRMYFEDTRLEEVIMRIESKFDVKIEMENEKLGNCMITANFTGQSLERTLSMIAQALGIEYEMKDRIIALHGSGCN